MRVFEPWVGGNYRTTGLDGLRVMVLGESHYGAPDTEKPSTTQDVVRKWGQSRRHRFFTLTQKVITGTDAGLSRADRRAFWEQVAFYNFIQRFVGDGPRVRPTQALWDDAAGPLLAVIEELKPHVLVVFGRALDAHLPPLPDDVVVVRLTHPAGRGFRLALAQQATRAALATARG
jgi:hypothetical protein